MYSPRYIYGCIKPYSCNKGLANVIKPKTRNRQLDDSRVPCCIARRASLSLSLVSLAFVRNNTLTTRKTDDERRTDKTYTLVTRTYSRKHS